MTYSIWALYCVIVGLVYVFRGDRCDRNDVMIHTESGSMLGSKILSTTGKFVNVFLGIPYAVPPVGCHRFRPPLDIEKWSGVLNAKVYGPACLQVVPRYVSRPPEWLVPKRNATSEDCLYLNIWTPNPIPTKAPVMVWIHGGGFSLGYGSSSKYDGQILASEENVIVVTLNYRLSVFGFMYLGAEELPGNVGLMDQASALRWVKRNVAKFGGDVNRITLFGESAGSASVGYQLLIPSSRHLFNRVIMQSGTPFNVWAFSEEPAAMEMTFKFAASVGCSAYPTYPHYHPKDMVYCLQQVPAEKLIMAAKNVNPRAGVTFTPVRDGKYIPKDLDTTIDDVPKEIEVLIGTNTGDGVYLMLADKVVAFSQDAMVSNRKFVDYVYSLTEVRRDAKGRLLMDLIRFFYTNWDDPTDPYLFRDQAVNFSDDFLFNCGVTLLSDMLSANDNKVYRYWFDVQPSVRRIPSWMRSFHGVEMDFIFGFPLDPTKGFTENETVLCRNMMGLWANFARNGSPQSTWPDYNQREKKYLMINLNSFEVKAGIRNQACTLWNYLFPKLKTLV